MLSNTLFIRSGHRHVDVRCGAELTAKGRLYRGEHLKIRRLIGQGSFGEVFEGVSMDEGVEKRVVLKRTRSKVAGATEMGQLEHVLNVHVSKCAPGSCADFMGFSDVSPDDAVADRRITPGTWLLWRYQGSMTLADYFKRRDCTQLISRHLNVPEAAMPATVIKQLAESLQKLHAAGLVHRDVKPSNIIFCEDDRRFRLIDLGACADLRSGTNYQPDESILDANYCAPEQYVLPTDAPDIAKQNSAVALAVAPMLWMRHKPDRFDMYSLGLIMLQLAMPHMRTTSAIAGFRTSFKRCRYDLTRWRTVSALRPSHTAVLDADGGAGWELATGLLQPREVKVLSDGHVYFTNAGQQRPPAADVLKSNFVRAQARETVPLRADEDLNDPTPEPPATSAAEAINNGIWSMFKKAQDKFFQVEGDLIRTASAAEQQTTTVRQLREAVETGDASPEELQEAEGVLQRLTTSLFGLQKNLSKAATSATLAYRTGLVGTQQVEKDEVIAALSRGDVAAVSQGLRAPEAVPEAVPPPKAKEQGFGALLFQGIKRMGRAVRLTSAVVDSVQEEAEKAMVSLEKSQEEKKRTAKEFMEMLNEEQVTVFDTWSQVEPRLLSDARYQAVVGERKLVLFKSYMRALNEAKDTELRAAENAFVAKLSSRVVDVEAVEWDTLKAEFAGDAVYAQLGEDRALMLFERFADMRRVQAAQIRVSSDREATYRAVLGTVQPPITGDTSWAQARKQLWEERAFHDVPDRRRREIFEEYRRVLRDLEAMQASQDVESGSASSDDDAANIAVFTRAVNAVNNMGRGALARGTADSQAGSDDAAQVLNKLREEQAKLKVEYDKMEEKLREMEERMQVTRAVDNDAASEVVSEVVSDVVTSGNGSSLKGR